MSQRPTPRIFKGTKDIMPEEMIPRLEMLRAIRGVFEVYGFAPLETPVMEYLDILLAKTGEETSKLVYPLAYKGGDTLGLRFDLTVPLARLVAQRPDLPLPFRRYQIQPVWRGERAQVNKGRFREFYQCDVDTIGTESLVADAENLAVAFDVYRALGLDGEDVGLRIRLNSRKLLTAMVEAAGLPEEMGQPCCTALDKIDKIGREAVEEILGKEGVAPESQTALFDLCGMSSAEDGSSTELIARLKNRLADTQVGVEGAEEVEQVLQYAVELGVPEERICVDLLLTRGMDYYTGPIYEFCATALPGFGSLGGGGRYDDLIGGFVGRTVPATGVCIGLSRVQEAMTRLGLLSDDRHVPTQALVLRFSDSPLGDALALTRCLRSAGVACEVYPEDARFKKQIQYAERKGIPFVLIQRESEIATGTVQVKNIESGEQVEVSVGALADHFKGQADR